MHKTAKHRTDSRKPMSGPIAVNYHLYKPCNLKCRFCFATFRDVRGRLGPENARRIITALRNSGAQKLTLVGGEPTLHPHICELIEHSKQVGFVTCIVTNGARLDMVLDRCSGSLDWVGLSIDSCDEATQAKLGRGSGRHIANSLRLAERCHELGVRLKLNTVVTNLNWHEDASDLVRTISPERWKVFQVLPMTGQNDGDVDDLLITRDQFEAYLLRHAHLSKEGYAPVAESNSAMKGSYAMVDPLGRFYGNATGRHVYSEPILSVGVAAALAQVGFVPRKLIERGGVYAW